MKSGVSVSQAIIWKEDHHSFLPSLYIPPSLLKNMVVAYNMDDNEGRFETDMNRRTDKMKRQNRQAEANWAVRGMGSDSGQAG